MEKMIYKSLRKAKNGVRVAYQKIRVSFYSFISSNAVIGMPRKSQPVMFCGKGDIRIDKNVTIGFFPSPQFLSTYAHIEARSKSACIEIKADTWISNNFCAIAEHTSIKIGGNCRIGSNVEIIDSDFHGLNVAERNISKPERARPVFIGSDVFVGSNVKILKGVTVGEGSVIANGSVVFEDIPPFTIAAGNPAKPIRKLQ